MMNGKNTDYQTPPAKAEVSADVQEVSPGSGLLQLSLIAMMALLLFLVVLRIFQVSKEQNKILPAVTSSPIDTQQLERAEVFGAVDIKPVTAQAQLLKLNEAVKVVPPLVDIPEGIVVQGTPAQQQLQLLRLAFLSGDEQAIWNIGQWFIMEGQKSLEAENARLAAISSYDQAARKNWSGGSYSWPANTITVLEALGAPEKAESLYADMNALINTQASAQEILPMGVSLKEDLSTSVPTPSPVPQFVLADQALDAGIPPTEGQGYEDVRGAAYWAKKLANESPVMAAPQSTGIGIAFDPVLWNMRDFYDFIIAGHTAVREVTILKVTHTDVLGGKLTYVIFGDKGTTAPVPDQILYKNRWWGSDKNGNKWFMGVFIGFGLEEGQTIPIRSLVKMILG